MNARQSAIDTLTTVAGAKLLWMGLRAAKLHHLVAMGAGAYLVARGLSRSNDSSNDADAEILGQQPTPEVEADAVDAASWASFPASDPPSHSPSLRS